MPLEFGQSVLSRGMWAKVNAVCVSAGRAGLSLYAKLWSFPGSFFLKRTEEAP